MLCRIITEFLGYDDNGFALLVFQSSEDLEYIVVKKGEKLIQPSVQSKGFTYTFFVESEKEDTDAQKEKRLFHRTMLP